MAQFSWKPIFSTVSVDGFTWWKTIAPLERSEEISPTLQFHGFTCIADLVDADFQVLVPIDASGDSISQELWERHLCQMCLVPMFGAESDLAGKWHIWISADGIAFAPSEYQASICLEGINAWLRTQSLPEWSWRFFIGKIALNVDFSGNWTTNYWPPFLLDGLALVHHSTSDAYEGTLAAITRHDCWQIVRAAGFGIDIQIRPCSGAHHPVVFRIVQGSLQPRICIADLRLMLFIGFFRYFMDELQMCPASGCHTPVTINFEGTIFWKGTLANQLLVQRLHDVWSSAHIRAPFVVQVRCVIRGRQASHEFALREFASPHGDIKIYLCMPLHGGGGHPEANALRNELSHFVQSCGAVAASANQWAQQIIDKVGGPRTEKALKTGDVDARLKAILSLNAAAGSKRTAYGPWIMDLQNVPAWCAHFLLMDRTSTNCGQRFGHPVLDGPN